MGCESVEPLLRRWLHRRFNWGGDALLRHSPDHRLRVEPVTQFQPSPRRLFDKAIEETQSVLVQISFVRTTLLPAVSGDVVCVVEHTDSERWVLINIEPHQQHGYNIRTVPFCSS